MAAPDPKKRDVLISKALSYLLRHGAIKENLTISEDGYIKISDLLNHNRLKSNKTTYEDIQRIVIGNDKQRFTISEDGEYICANQGHSLKVISNNNLTLFTQDNIPHEIYHGTYRNKLEAILISGGLSKMNRNHIHFTSTELSNISGIRQNANVLIYLDVEECLKNGIKFYRSLNDVILSEGNENGIISSKYFAKVVDLKSNQEIDISQY
ncbi:phosphotransferase KptA/Tpt1 [Scheffersomyces amazonensis]|uniref:phosphotransferase KptA/Tpt1 n=1 Tax=Scheffersomyces amazonensis TaxID=1078765 RepID=UPI00315CD4E2